MLPYGQIALVLSDLDETLLSLDHQVGQESRSAIAALQRAGVAFAICTGRAPEATRPIVTELGLRFYICNNGASVHDGARILAERTMSEQVAAALTAFFDRQAVPVYLMTPQGYFLTRRTLTTDAADQARGVAPALLPAERWHIPAHKVMAWGGAHLYDACQAEFGGQVHIIYHGDYLEIAPKGVSKQWGAEQLARHLHIPSGCVAAVGDARNDLEMIRWAGIGAAMGNADPLLKAEADLVLPGHDVDGAAQLFQSILGLGGTTGPT